jgi:hypothetical protein
MDQLIIYNTDQGLAIMLPTPEYLADHDILSIAKKDVPAGKKFKIINRSDLPSDWSQNYAWSFDESSSTDGIGEKP